MAEAFERADRCGISRIRICAAGGQHAAGECGVVAAAVLRVEHHAGIEQQSLILGILPVKAQQREDGLRIGFLGTQRMHDKAFAVKMLPLDLIGRRHDDGQPRDHGDRDAHFIFDGLGFAFVVVRIQRQHRPRHFVHDIVGGCLRDHVNDKAVRQLAVFRNQRPEFGQLLHGRQLAEQQKICGFLVAETALPFDGVNQIRDLVAAVDQLAGNRLHFALVKHIAVDVADLGDARDDARAVGFSQAAVDLIFLIQRRVQCGGFPQPDTQLFDVIRIAHACVPFLRKICFSGNLHSFLLYCFSGVLSSILHAGSARRHFPPEEFYRALPVFTRHAADRGFFGAPAPLMRAALILR